MSKNIQRKAPIKPDQFIEHLLKAWRTESANAKLYQAASEKEGNPEVSRILARIAAEETKHAQKWSQRLCELGRDPGDFVETRAESGAREKLLARNSDSIVRCLESAEHAAAGMYTLLASLAPTEADKMACAQVAREEKVHDTILKSMGRDASPAHRLSGILSRENHVHAGGWIGQAIYGINDGLGAAFGVVSGVAGATNVNSNFVLISGLAAMVASALSMGSGAYLAAKSEKEVNEAEIERERQEILENPEEEKQELSLFYQLKGFSESEAEAMSARMSHNPEAMLKTLAHEELGLSAHTFPNPLRSAGVATLATACGAVIPVLPYFFLSSIPALVTSFVISTAAHFAVGAAKVVVTGRQWWKSGLEMMLIGLAEAAITFGIGLLIAPLLQ